MDSLYIFLPPGAAATAVKAEVYIGSTALVAQRKSTRLLNEGSQVRTLPGALAIIWLPISIDIGTRSSAEEQWSSKPKVAGSNPAGCAMHL